MTGVPARRHHRHRLPPGDGVQVVSRVVGAIGADSFNGRDEGVTTLLFDDSSEAHGHGRIVGTHAGDMIGEIALAIEMGADAVDIGKTIHPHPTLGESLGMAAEAAHGSCTDVPPTMKRQAAGCSQSQVLGSEVRIQDLVKGLDLPTHGAPVELLNALRLQLKRRVRDSLRFAFAKLGNRNQRNYTQK